jgi:hypothetical protein
MRPVGSDWMVRCARVSQDLLGAFVWRKHGIEDVFDFSLPKNENESLQQSGLFDDECGRRNAPQN